MSRFTDEPEGVVCVCAHSARAFLDGLASRIRAESVRSSALLHQDEPAPEISSAAITTTHRAEKQQRQDIPFPKGSGTRDVPADASAVSAFKQPDKHRGTCW